VIDVDIENAIVKNRLEQILSDRGLKQNWLALQVGISKQTMSNLVKNRFNTSADVGLKIAYVLGMNFNEIFYLE